MISQRDAERYNALYDAKQELTEASLKYEKALRIAREALQEYAAFVN